MSKNKKPRKRSVDSLKESLKMHKVILAQKFLTRLAHSIETTESEMMRLVITTEIIDKFKNIVESMDKRSNTYMSDIYTMIYDIIKSINLDEFNQKRSDIYDNHNKIMLPFADMTKPSVVNMANCKTVRSLWFGYDIDEITISIGYTFTLEIDDNEKLFELVNYEWDNLVDGIPFSKLANIKYKIQPVKSLGVNILTNKKSSSKQNYVIKNIPLDNKMVIVNLSK